MGRAGAANLRAPRNGRFTIPPLRRHRGGRGLAGRERPLETAALGTLPGAAAVAGGMRRLGDLARFRAELDGMPGSARDSCSRRRPARVDAALPGIYRGRGTQ